MLICGPKPRPAPIARGLTLVTYASTYPAVQNLLLAARAYGLGGVLTVNHEPKAQEICELVGIPEDRMVLAIVPLGYPAQKHGKKSRKPVEAVTSLHHWGEPMRV